MSKLLIICLLFFSVLNNSYSQKFTTNELIKLYENNDDFLETKVLENGYHSIMESNDAYAVKPNEPLFNYIGLRYYPKISDTSIIERCIDWIFTSDELYLMFKKELIAEGYPLYYERESKYYGKQFFYKNDHYKFIITKKSQKFRHL